MGNFEYISIVAVLGYLLLFMIFVSAKKNRLINSYLMVLLASIAWTGGSFLMRIQAWPSYRVWYHVSLCGLLLLAYALYWFLCTMAGKQSIWTKIWFAVIALCCLINCLTGFFLDAPEYALTKDGSGVFTYHMTWHVAFLFIVTGVMVCHMLYILTQGGKKNPLFWKKMAAPVAGILTMFAGNLALLLPSMEGFPIDILAGLVNALFMFYALVRQRLFRLKFLASEGVCYVTALIATLLVFYRLSPGLLTILKSRFPWMEENYVMVFAAMVVVVSMGFVLIWKKVISAVFVKEEQIQQEYLQKFSLSVSKSLRLKDIYQSIVSVIEQATDVEDVYICMQKKKGYPYEMTYADSDLKPTNFLLRDDHPIVNCLREKEDFLSLKDFQYTVAGKALWEEEKQMLDYLSIAYAIGLKDNEQLIGIILFSNKQGKATISQNDSTFLSSVGSIASIAIRNSMLYEKAYREAITDELTGLLNRKYFVEKFQKVFTECRDSSLVLVMLNVDDFKLFNQLYGIGEGDKALQQIARIIRASVGENGIVSRYSGKEFAILLPHYDVLAARTLTESISRQIHQMNSRVKNYAMKRLTISAGISAYPYGAHSMKEMFENVDLAIYHVKRHGKNAIRIADSRTDIANPAAAGNQQFTPKNIYQEYESTIYALTAAIDTKDHYTFRHSNNVSYYATMLAEALNMSAETVEIIRQAALLHDIGKIGIPEQILNKPSRLTDEEYKIIQGHVEASIGIIRHLPSLDYVVPAVLGHHEHYDGHGYPRGLAGEAIPLTGRILCIADSFDAIVSKRCYKKPVPLEQARNILVEETGRQFDPEMVTVFIRLLDSGKVKIAADEENIQKK